MLVTPKQIARATGLSESTVKRWCDRGILPTLRTPGGHRRLELAHVVRILRARGMPVVDALAFGLPPFEELAADQFAGARRRLEEALIAADRTQVSAILHSLVLGGTSMAGVGDRVVAPVFDRIGQLWSCQELEVYQEREACLIMQEALLRLRNFLEVPPPDAPLAIGGALAADHYVLPSVLVELVFVESGWQARYLGSNLPQETLIEAIERIRPEAFWLSMSFTSDEEAVVNATRQLAEAARHVRSLFLIGGQAISEKLERQIVCSAYCHNLAQLEVFLRTLPHLRRRGGEESQLRERLAG